MFGSRCRNLKRNTILTRDLHDYQAQLPKSCPLIDRKLPVEIWRSTAWILSHTSAEEIVFMIFKLLDPWHWKTPEMLGSTSFFSATEGPSTPVQLVACDGHLSLSATTPAFFWDAPNRTCARSRFCTSLHGAGWLQNHAKSSMSCGILGAYSLYTWSEHT